MTLDSPIAGRVTPVSTGEDAMGTTGGAGADAVPALVALAGATPVVVEGLAAGGADGDGAGGGTGAGICPVVVAAGE